MAGAMAAPSRRPSAGTQPSSASSSRPTCSIRGRPACGTERRHRSGMDLAFSAEDEAFRAEVRRWLTERLEGPFAVARGRGGPGDEHELFDERLAWEQELGRADWIGVGWPKEAGGRGLSLYQQVIW